MRFIRIFRWIDIKFTHNSEDLEFKDGSVDDFKHLEGTVYHDYVDCLVYETALLSR